MRLQKLTLRNFKGIREFVFDPNGQNANIYGDNGVGKTTLPDSFYWLLFGKDSLNRADFDIKTLTPDGEPIHNLEHEAEAVLEHNGKTFTLRKVYYEKWTQKRGSAHKTFEGNKTDYYIDGVPKPKKDYEAFIASLIDEKIFKLLTNPTYFNEQLHWQKRREILLDVCGDLTDEEVIASDKTLAGLPAILGDRSLDDHRKVIAARKAKINDELKSIPVRINEVNRAMHDISQFDKAKLEQDIPFLKEQIREQEQALARLQSGGEVVEKQKRIREIESELLDLKNKHRAKVDSEVDKERQKLNAVKKHVDDTQGNIHTLTRNQKNLTEEIASLESRRITLREEWTAINGQEFTFEQDDTCPTCGQVLPEEQLQEAREKAEAAFNLKKSTELSKISQKGKEVKAEIEKHQAQLPLYEENLKQFKESLAAYQKQIESMESAILTLHDSSFGNIASNPEYAAKEKEIAQIKGEISSLQSDTSSEQDGIRSEIERISAALLAVETNLAKIKQNEQGEARIKELESQEKTLAAEFEKLEGELFLCESFIKAKVALLEDKINGKFQMVKFKLFEVQVNGGINECCETTVNGVPYSSGLNKGHQNAAGMDIINTLSEHYGFWPVIFVDNAESITVLPKMQAQVIRLVVSEPDKQLRVEIESEKEGVLFE